MSTVGEILASGRYVDRRGRSWDYVETVASWCSPEIDAEGVSWGYRYLDAAQMRLLIERDEHRDVCPRLSACSGHPVPSVLAPFEWGSRDFEVYAAWENATGTFEKSLAEAMDAARALAVGE